MGLIALLIVMVVHRDVCRRWMVMTETLEISDIIGNHLHAEELLGAQ